MSFKKMIYATASMAMISSISLSSIDFTGERGLMIGERVHCEALDAEMKDANTLVCFWASHNAESVIKAKEAIGFAKSVGGMKVITVSLDDYQTIADEVSHLKGLDADLTIREGADSQSAADFKLKDGEFGTFLVGADGRLQAINF